MTRRIAIGVIVHESYLIAPQRNAIPLLAQMKTLKVIVKLPEDFKAYGKENGGAQPVGWVPDYCCKHL